MVSSCIMVYLITMLIPYHTDIAVLVILPWSNVVHYSSLFQYFYVSAMAPTLVENFNFLYSNVQCVYMHVYVMCLYICACKCQIITRHCPIMTK